MSDIREILSSVPHNSHYLNRYIAFIEGCRSKPLSDNQYFERHHVCPKEIFPEFKDIIAHPWNNVNLSARQHFIAHLILSECFGGSQTYAFWAMCNRQSNPWQKREYSINSKTYENAKRKFLQRRKQDSDSINDKIIQTNLERRGVRYTLSDPETRQKGRETMMERYGVDSPQKNIEIKRRTRETNLRKYGTIVPSMCEEISERIRATCINKYGVEHAFQSEEVKEKIRQTNLERYGVANASVAESVKKKIRETNLSIYGVEHAFQSEEIKKKIKETNRKRFGVDYANSSDIVKEKKRNTYLLKYGVSNWMQSEEAKEYRKSIKPEPCVNCGRMIKGKAGMVNHLKKCNINQ